MRLLAILMLIALPALPLLAQTSGKLVTITGEVVDTQCYISGAMGEGKGATHKKCALSCAKGGIPLSILDDRNRTLVLAGQTKAAMKGANEMLMDYVAEKVRVTGRMVERGGLRMIIISKVERVEGEKKKRGGG